MTDPAVPITVWVGLVTVLGLATGSFLNVVVHRVPAGVSVVRPPSSCPACGHVVRARDNVPVLSWLALGGRCRDCRAAIPVRYPLVEAGTAALFAIVTVRVGQTQGPTVLVASLLVAAACVALALIDQAHGRLPFSITGVAAVAAAATLAVGWRLGQVSGTAVAGGIAVWLVVYGGIWLGSAGRGMGLGDVALAPLLGAVLGAVGIGSAIVGLAAGFVLGALAGTVLMLRGRARRGTRIAHGPFLVVGAGFGLLWGGALASAYLDLVGLT
ncbi:prepilin peptidase [Nocardioides mangrovi]|uniref:Prepilin peptidase n=1 Tax=Nocardioides mangrovi TaxID=2874580 RepID=A0ABS7UJF7_9ACTN|nr:A24 family peptidase [Nocardioides mangrovi]MBZ5740033.1 prepilin peptidase [Nocardioides mangrovi]MBZ5740796.1 prepilin peptidase [Nocardioides mangrovi]